MEQNKVDAQYYLGVDMGVASVGWAVTNPEYEVIRKAGKALWGVRLFEEAVTAEGRRISRIARRRIERRRVRMALLQRLFEKAVLKKDPNFFIRLNDSRYFPDDKREEQRNTLFNDKEFTDKNYHKEYPTIYHLRKELMDSDKEHDVRLVYLAIHHILKHRGHFLIEGHENNIEAILNFERVFLHFSEAIRNHWNIEISESEAVNIRAILKNKNNGKMGKKKDLEDIFLKMDGLTENRTSVKPMIQAISALLVGTKASLVKLYGDENLQDTGVKEINFNDTDYETKEAELPSILGEERYDLIIACREVYEWSLLATLMGDFSSLSEAKIAMYKKHKKDLEILKRLLKPYRELYKKVFLDAGKGSYTAYAGKHVKNKEKLPIDKKSDSDEFYDEIKRVLKKIPDSSEKAVVLTDIEKENFLPKGKARGNSVIPYQLHLMELKKILRNAETYLPFLKESDEDGTISDKIESLLTFRIPYYVGPLNNHSGKYWAIKKDENGYIYPWNFDKKVDREASATAFIENLTNKCTYLVREDVLPKNSLLYTEYMVLNELNNVCIGGARQKLTQEEREAVWNDLFLKHKKVTQKRFRDYLIKMGKGEPVGDMSKSSMILDISGMDGDFKSSLGPWIDMQKILGDQFDIQQAEQMIKDITALGAEKRMLNRWLATHYKGLSKEQVKNLSRLRYTGWGRLSKKLLLDIYPKMKSRTGEVVDPMTGEPWNILTAMRKTGKNFMELMSNDMGYMDAITDENESELKGQELNYKVVDELQVSPAVKRPVWQTVKIIKEVTKIMGGPPSHIFLEMAREVDAPKKRTQSRKQKLKDLYKACKKDIREWNENGDILSTALDSESDERLRSDKLFLYYMQMGKSMYTGEPIHLKELWTTTYDIDHIYPRSQTGDDSMDNRVLVETRVNRKKSDKPISDEVRNRMQGFWNILLAKKFITKEKYHRLMRSSALTVEEKSGFIGRHLVETRQSTKVVATLLRETYSETKVVYVKAGHVSKFRQLYDFIKIREMNDYHHAKDAYLNIVVGNAFYTKFTDNPIHFFVKNKNPQYSLNEAVFYGHDIERNGRLAWKAGEEATKGEQGKLSMGKGGTADIVRKYMKKNDILVTRMTHIGTGGLFDQNPLKKGKGQISLKGTGPIANIERYGGYKNPTVAYFTYMEAMDKKGQPVYFFEPIPLHMASKLKTKQDKIEYFRKKWDEEGQVYKEARICLPQVPIKSVLEVNGYRAYISGKTNKRFAMWNGVELFLPKTLEVTLKKVVKYTGRIKGNPNLKITERDGIVDADLIILYEEFRKKLTSGIYNRPYASVAKTIQNGYEIFLQLSIEDKCVVLSEVLHLFQCNAVAADLRLIGGAQHSGVLIRGMKMKDGEKSYLVTTSVTGFFEKKIPLAPYREP